MNVKGIFDGVFGESKAKYTPGPWSLSANYHQTQKVVSDSCEIVKLPPTEVGKANARLIAAAPEMLEALEECYKYWVPAPENYNEHSYFPSIGRIREAIAKAKGES